MTFLGAECQTFAKKNIFINNRFSLSFFYHWSKITASSLSLSSPAADSVSDVTDVLCC